MADNLSTAIVKLAAFSNRKRVVQKVTNNIVLEA